MGKLIICVDPAGPRHNTGIAVFHGTALLASLAHKIDATDLPVMQAIIDGTEDGAHDKVHLSDSQGNGDGGHCHRDATWFVEEPGLWMAGAKAGKNWRSLVVLQRAIGAWMALTGATPVPDDAVKAALTGDRAATKARVQWVLKALEYKFHENNEADAIALGHYMSNKLALEARVAPEETRDA